MKIFKTTWLNIRRSPYQAFAAVLVMTLTFLFISFFTFLLFGSAKAISYFESRPQVTAFFRNETKQVDIDNLKNELNATNKIASLKFVSKQDALKIYREQNKNDPLLLELVTADILPASLEISTIKIEDLSAINNMLCRNNNCDDSLLVSEVVFQKDVVSVLTSWTNALRTIGLGLIIVLSLVSVFIMVIIIGVKISQKKQDIGIMKLIGAGDWYIRTPFVFEGIYYGVVGAILGWLISAGALWYATPFLSSFLKGMPIFPVPPIFLFGLLGAEILVAIVLGTLSSFLAVLRYLK
ncbi:MAG: permease-like cell division protein FtsX [Candidatus Levybacteria bacterium]|nr:permease-like cell division protein FtsX [Candidatus Levybacteria bacterium]